MDRGSGLNILYANTLELDRSQLQGDAAPFHGNVTGKHTRPLGRIDLPVCFGTPSNYRKEVLKFEVVGFKGTYHAILGRPCYAKFMAVPNYTYLKLKMPGPNGVITVESTYEHAYDCDINASSTPRLSWRLRPSSSTSSDLVARRLTPSVVPGLSSPQRPSSLS